MKRRILLWSIAFALCFGLLGIPPAEEAAARQETTDTPAGPTIDSNVGTLSPDLPILIRPANEQTKVPVDRVYLEVSVNDPDNHNLTVSFYGRENCPASNFTVVALPDTQHYSQDYPAIFTSQTNWIVANRTTRNIAFVTHLGDVVNSASDPAQWANAVAAMNLLEVLPPIPYGLAVGNHDENPESEPKGTAEFNTYFGISRFSGQPYYGGSYNGLDNDNSYQLFSSGNMDFIVLHFGYNINPPAALLDWANGLLQTYSNRQAIVIVHNLLAGVTSPAPFSSQGLAVYNALKGNPNLFLMLGGHIDTEVTRNDVAPNGNTIYSLRSDYQNRLDGGDGWLRLMEFQPAANQIQVYTYSPYLDQSETDPDSQFILPYSMDRAGCNPFHLIQTLTDVPSGTNASYHWDSLGVSVKYDWYVTVSHGTQTVNGPVWSFTTGISPIRLLSFTATSSPFAIQLDWQTAQESDLLGFNVYRAQSPISPRHQLNQAMIPALTPGQQQGNPYQFTDTTARNGQTYYYWVEWVGLDGNELFGPLSAGFYFYTWLSVVLKHATQ